MVQEFQRQVFHHPSVLDRLAPDGIGGGLYHYTPDMYRRTPSLQIDEALRLHCSISARRYFVAVIMDDGSPMTFSGPGTAGLGNDVIQQFFHVDEYRRVMGCLDSGASLGVGESFGVQRDLYRSVNFPRKRTLDPSDSDGWEVPTPPGRKRRQTHRPVDHDEGAPLVVSTTRKGIEIGSLQDVWNFYEQRFKNCQQTTCKLIAKAWIKAVEPKKQSTHPYTGSDEKAPEWWPKPWGPTNEDKVRHKEPDHLYKRERVHLLNHILRMIVEPKEKQHPDIQKLNLNVKKLEEITTEALSAFFADKENSANIKKRPYLNEIFKVARQEERFKKGEIDGTTQVYVMAQDKVPEAYSENDNGSITKDEDDQDVPSTKLSTVQSLMPPTLDHSSSLALHGTPFLSDLPVRGTQYTPQLITEITPDRHGFVEGPSMSVGGQTSVHSAGGSLALDIRVATSQDSSRRPSISSPSLDYSGQPSTNMYAQQWQPGSTAPNTSSMYAFT